MEVDDFELLELVNDYQERSDEPTFNTLDDIPEALMIEALDEANYIEDEINDYMMVEAGESFTDYCKVAGNDWLDHCIQYVVDHCGEYLTQWVPAEEYHLSWQLEEMAIYPLADFILKDDGAWEDFVDFFTSEKETASGTPYIDCYDIRELFENGDV